MGGDQLHVMVADVIKSLDTVDKSFLGCALGRLGLPSWFRKVYFSCHNQVRLRFKFAAGLGESWCRDGGIPLCCPLSMVFIVALPVPWCRHLEALPSLGPSFMRTTSSAVLSVQMSSSLLGSLLSMLGLSVRMSPLHLQSLLGEL